MLSAPRKGLNSILGAALGALTPFCSCSTIPVLVGLFKSGAPFCGAISFLMSSPLLNPGIIALFLMFFGLKTTAVYVAFTFAFAVIIGVFLDKLGMEKEVKNVTIKGEKHEEITYDKLQGSFMEKNKIVIKSALTDAVGLFIQVFPYLLIGAGIGAFIHGFVPENLIARLAGKSSFYSVPVAAIIGIPMYIRTETMIPIAQVLVSKGMSYGTVMALIIGGAGASIPELVLLNSIFKKKMKYVFVISIFAVAIITGYAFNIVI
ncbi:MAG: permease [Tepidanaerobacteraceae bacterium]|nr:permease [Tepidanaerobacteraceae bacterium]